MPPLVHDTLRSKQTQFLSLLGVLYEKLLISLSTLDSIVDRLQFIVDVSGGLDGDRAACLC